MMMAELHTICDAVNAAHAILEAQHAVLQQIERRMNNIPNQPGEVHNARAVFLEFATASQGFYTNFADYEEKVAQFEMLNREIGVIMLDLEQAADLQADGE